MKLLQLAQSLTLQILRLAFILLLVLTLLFFLQRLSGDPASVLAGHTATPEMLEQIREDMGLNEPLHIQYATFLSKAVMLDFGDSLRFQQPAFDLVLERFPETLMLSGSAIVLAIMVGVPLGTYAAINSRRWDGKILNLLAGVLQSLPSFWLGLILLLIFSVQLKWVGSVSLLEDDLLKRMALPTITLAAFYLARLLRLVRSGLIEELSQDYIITARSKGLHSRRVLWVHAFRNALLPVVAFITLDMSVLVGGSVVVETLFSYDGIGNQTVQAIFNRDYALVQATVFMIAVMVLCINSFSNFMYRFVDPRVRA